MTLQELQQTDWYKTRPLIIQEAINLLPPTQLYQFKDSKKQCYIIGYDEPTPKLLQDVTLVVQKTGIGGHLYDAGLSINQNNQVFGVKIDDLEPADPKNQYNPTETEKYPEND